MKISVIGLGYVGLPLAVLLARSHEVVGYDIDRRKVEQVKAGDCPIYEKGLPELLQTALDSNRLVVSSEPDSIRASVMKIITVGTPYNESAGMVDYSQLDSSVKTVAAHLKRGDVVLLKSTIPPGTTNQRVRPFIESRGFKVPEHVGLAFSPERMVEGQAISDFTTLPKLIGATDVATQRKVKSVLKCLGGKIITVTSPETAEMAKLIDNYSRFVFLGLTNEIALMADRIGVDANELIKSVKEDYPRNAGLLKPGPGVGGSCLNKDPLIMRAEMARLGLQLRMMESAKTVNDSMPIHVADMIKMLAHDRKRICIAGVAFKGDTDDTRFSPVFEIGGILEKNGFSVSFTDPFAKISGMKITRDVYRGARRNDVVLILTDHSAYRDLNLKKLKKRMSPKPLMIDTRGIITRDRAIEAGFEFHGLGAL